MRILVVEDEKRLNAALCQILREQKYMVDAAFDGAEGEALASSDAYDVIVLDVMLPRKDGFAVAADLRRQGHKTPILMLTARDTVRDKVSGLDSGADDYMTKPFAPEELLARVRALSRRPGELVSDEASFGDLTFEKSASLLKCGDKNVRLNFKESEILSLLITHPAMLLSKDDILIKVWGYDSDAGDANVEAYVSFLRKKLTFLGSKVTIVAVKKQGYRLEAPAC
ncbi:MAG: response regulator transcription factor [Clostridia bacterium]|nr:response regulator transcription factor [Clostridia bacterium]